MVAERVPPECRRSHVVGTELMRDRGGSGQGDGRGGFFRCKFHLAASTLTQARRHIDVVGFGPLLGRGVS
jgi:hypothetical protein